MDTCAQYVEDAYSSREKDARRLLKLAHGEYSDKKAERVESELGDVDSYILAIDVRRVVDITISTGGPGEGIEARLSRASHGGWEIDSATFYAAWGSDKRETRLDPSDSLWQLAEYYVETLED